MFNNHLLRHGSFVTYLVFFLIILINQPVSAQESLLFSDEHLMLLVEELGAQHDGNIDLTILQEEFTQLAANPVVINYASFEELSRIRLLSDFQIQSLINYIHKNGPVLSTYELQFVYGFDEEFVRLILPFIDLQIKERAIPDDLDKKLASGTHQIFLRSSRKFDKESENSPNKNSIPGNGTTSPILGNPTKLYIRYDYRYKRKIRWGITAEKDAGEEFFKGINKNGFDFYSAHLQINNFGFVKNLSIGDYHLRFGQGLVLWSGFSFGKTSMPLDIKKRAAGITGYRSTDENRFFRGLATTLTHNNIDLSFFYSGKKIDGNITEYDSTRNKAITVSSLQTTGDHSLAGLASDKDAVLEQVFGTNLTMNFNKVKTGLTFAHTWLDTKINPPDRYYNQFYFRGKQLTHLSGDYQFLINRINLYGEAAYCFGRGWAILNGALFNLSSEFSLAMLYRNFEKEYFSFYGNAFAENSGGRNEKGFYLGAEISPLANWKVSAYFDAYKFPWLRYLVTSPSSGTDYLIKIDYHPSSQIEMYWKIKGESDIADINEDLPGITDQEAINRLNIRYHLSYITSPNLRFRNRIEIARCKTGDFSPEWGYILYQDILFTFPQLPVDIRARYAIFDTDSYNTRIYTYENDVLYSFSVPALFSKGTRSYLLVKYSPG
ncbi:MAG: helix-hairpin-helix domain-containing protein, partial [Bacteroidetes bacterium]|nr:helix-hairpin-helix domain-containing protein [Bacteroidota bacterium]